jgi:hypothetical protein
MRHKQELEQANKARAKSKSKADEASTARAKQGR